MTDAAVKVRSVNLSLREQVIGPPVTILDSASLTVPRGAIYGLLGPSGCGKTSLLRCVMGCLKVNSGDIKVFGASPGTRDSGIPGPLVGFMPQEIALHTDLSIDEMLKYFGRLYMMSWSCLDKRIDHLLSVLDLPEKTRLIANLSGGQRRRVSFATALLHSPRLLILDEPTVGVDPILSDKIWKYLVSLATNEGITTIITTHYIEETRQANVIGFMRKGSVLAEGTPNDLMIKYSSNSLEQVFWKLCKITHREPVKPVTWTSSVPLDRVKKSNDIIIASGSPWLIQLQALITKYLIQTSRQPESVVGQFLLPILCLVMFCVCIGGTPAQLPIGVINDDNDSQLSRILLKSLNSYILKQMPYNSFDRAVEDVKRGHIWGVLHIPANFSDSFLTRVFFDEDVSNETIKQSNVRLYADLTNKILGVTMDTVLVQTFEDFTSQALIELGYSPSLGRFPLELGETVYGSFSKSDFFGVRDFAAPGFLIVITYSVAYALTCLSLILERMDAMFERNYASGVTTSQILLSILLVRFIFVAIGTTLLLVMAVQLFDVPCRGSFWAVLLMLLLQSLAGMGMGLCVSSVAKDFFICAAISNGLLLFTFIISGVLWSLQTLPYYVRWFSFVQPTTVPAEAMRSMLTRGLNITHPSVWPGFLITTVWASIFLFTATRIFKYQK